MAVRLGLLLASHCASDTGTHSLWLCGSLILNDVAREWEYGSLFIHSCRCDDSQELRIQCWAEPSSASSVAIGRLLVITSLWTPNVNKHAGWVICVFTCVCMCTYVHRDQRWSLTIFLSCSLPYLFETGSVTETGAHACDRIPLCGIAVVCSAFVRRYRGSNLGPHGCVASPSPSEPSHLASPLPHLFFWRW